MNDQSTPPQIAVSNDVAPLEGRWAQIFRGKFGLAHAASGVKRDRRDQAEVERVAVRMCYGVISDLGIPNSPNEALTPLEAKAELFLSWLSTDFLAIGDLQCSSKCQTFDKAIGRASRRWGTANGFDDPEA
jgi:hypothetical protein